MCVCELFENCSVHIPPLQAVDSESIELEQYGVNPWSASTMKELLTKIDPQIMKYNVGYFSQHCSIGFIDWLD